MLHYTEHSTDTAASTQQSVGSVAQYSWATGHINKVTLCRAWLVLTVSGKIYYLAM